MDARGTRHALGATIPLASFAGSNLPSADRNLAQILAPVTVGFLGFAASNLTCLAPDARAPRPACIAPRAIHAGRGAGHFGIRRASDPEMTPTRDMRVAALVASGFEQVELSEPRRAFESIDVSVEIVSPKKDTVRAWHRTDWGDDFQVDAHVGDVDLARYASLLIPGGLLSADYLRMDQRAVDLVNRFMKARKPIAALCHGVWLLVEANVVSGRSVTSYPSLRTDLENAGARWRDEPVVVDGMILTLRRQDDLPTAAPRLLELHRQRDNHLFGPPEQMLQR
jgi:protease I